MAAGDRGPQMGLEAFPEVEAEAAEYGRDADGSVTLRLTESGTIFRIERRIARALQGKVYLAVLSDEDEHGRCIPREDEEGNVIRVAVKRLEKRCVRAGITTDGRRVDEDPVTEWRILRYLANEGAHEHVMTLEALGEDEHYYFAVYPFYSSGDLFGLTTGSRGGYLPEAQAKLYFRHLLQGLAFCHARGIIHRDVSLENTMMEGVERGENGIAILIDFGLAVDHWAEGPGDLSPRRRAGKTNYMPPEVYEGGAFNETADLWCLGMSLWMMLFGAPLYNIPAAGSDRFFDEVRAGKLRGLVEAWGFAERVSPEAVDLIERMLQVDPARRPDIPTILAHPWMSDALDDLGGQEAAVADARAVLDLGERVNASGIARDAPIRWDILEGAGDDDAGGEVEMVEGGGGEESAVDSAASMSAAASSAAAVSSAAVAAYEE